MAYVNVLRPYRKATHSGKRWSEHFAARQDWARRVGKRIPAFEVLPSQSRVARLRVWLSWRLHYATASARSRWRSLRSLIWGLRFSWRMH